MFILYPAAGMAFVAAPFIVAELLGIGAFLDRNVTWLLGGLILAVLAFGAGIRAGHRDGRESFDTCPYCAGHCVIVRRAFGKEDDARMLIWSKAEWECGAHLKWEPGQPRTKPIKTLG